MDLTAALDPNIAALLGNGGGNDQFTQMLMRAINPGAAADLSKNLGPPALGPIQELARRPPPVARGYVQPELAAPQMMQTLGFGMAAAAGAPGSSGLSALGEGGREVVTKGENASERSLRQAQIENQANLDIWAGKSKLAEAALNAQMKGPELDLKLMDLTGSALARNAAREDTAAYRAGLLTTGAAKTGISQQNADTNAAKAGTAQQRAETYATSVEGQLAAKTAANELRAKEIEASAARFEKQLLMQARLANSRIGLETAGRAATEFKNEMTLRRNPITGELPDEETQEALRQSIAAKYQQAAGGTAPAADQPSPEEVLQQARDAIAAGADRAAVIERLNKMGVNSAGL